MLHDFLTRERATILEVAKRKAAESRSWRLASGVIEEGWGIFYDDLTGYLIRGRNPESAAGPVEAPPEPKTKAYLKLGYAITEAVQSYHIIYQAITEAAAELNEDLAPEELDELKQSLDTAIADVVKAFEESQRLAQGEEETKRLGFLAHELRNCIQNVTLSFDLIRTGIVGVEGKTGNVLTSSLERMTKLIDTALTAVRMQMEPAAEFEPIQLCEIMSDVEMTSLPLMNAGGKSLDINCASEINVLVDRHLFVSALSNLVQNALKFSKPDAKIEVRATTTGEVVRIEVEDECGGLPDGALEELFEPGVQKGEDRSGVGLGLAISKRAVERNGGKLTVENLPGKGCIFVIELPKPVSVHSPAFANNETAPPQGLPN